MFQDEKTTELDLNSFTPSKQRTVSAPRWTEKHSAVAQQSPATTLNFEQKHSPLLIKFAAAVTILILSLWLF